MSDIQLTIFNAIEINKEPKVAFSKTFDKNHIFININKSTLLEAFKIMSTNFTLSQPLNIKEPTFLKRDKENLNKFKYKKITNIIIDLDKIKTKENYLFIIKYFENKKYSCILGKSRSWDGKDNFNIKGIIRCSIENKEEIIKSILLKLQTELLLNCKVDLTVGNFISYQAPTNSNQIIYHKENGKILTDSETQIENIKTIINNNYNIDFDFENKIIIECLSIFKSLGYSPIKGDKRSDKAINFYHLSERKTKGGFFWFSSSPLIMNHHNKSRTISIFNLLKETEIGKKWLKEKTKKEQENKLIINKNYKNQLIINERYLDFKKENKKELINKWIKTKNDVLKIKSAMGTAKSNGIKLIIDEAHKKNLKVILISNRVSVAIDFAEKYNILLYKDRNAWKQNQSVVVQFDSLHKFDIENFDIVILDEFISLLFHHRSNLTNNHNINVIKFKIFMETKKIVVADAFLTGYEDIFFKNREIFNIENNYRDNINLFEYKSKEKFISNIIKYSKTKEKNKVISCSFTSNNILKVTYNLLKENNIKVIILNSETSEYTREIIYKKFKSFEHNAFDVILYSPTLTVGVSNLNNIDNHFHYDTGMSTDVISSLQMIKRSRNTKNIHIYLEERQFYNDIDVRSINSTAEKNINSFYNKKDSTLLVEVNYETGKLNLTRLAKYINQIEAFYNLIKNNHTNAFTVLLPFQFKTKIVTESFKELNYKINIKEIQKEIKESENKELLEILNDYKDININIDEIKNKTINLTDNEKVKLIVNEIKNKFLNKTEDEYIKIAKKQIIDKQYINKLNRYNIMNKIIKNSFYGDYLLSKVISSDISSLQNKSFIDFLRFGIEFKLKIKSLKDRYSNKEIREINKKMNSKKFLKFIQKMGFIKGEAKYFIE